MFSENLKNGYFNNQGGSNAGRGFDYQIACSFLALLNLNRTGDCDDYFVLLEYYDDITVVKNCDKCNEE